ncbi:hypothetical protein E8E12_002442 [Didymella heteroderae]|uniref:Uncharacterized protein n=1 Tax=Didymella heteroderae TaxID=1769908 RepID=A0A9P4WMF3_9PLEO|nr:hypothetical protein E8E12_002442 [Didymella heteroderae]
MPPKRMSDILQSSSIDARISSTPLPTAATDTSDGPSLPIIGATTGTSTKRKRTAAAPPRSKNAAPQPQTNTIHPSLYTPWLLLPAKQRKEIEARGTQALDVLVWSKNQNVKSGINEGYGEQMEDGGGEAMDVDEGQEGGAVRETQRSETAEMKTVPVLSVWMTRKRMAGWKEVFGEQEMVVHETKG